MQKPNRVVPVKVAKKKSDRKRETVKKEEDWIRFSKGEYRISPFQALSDNQVTSYNSAKANNLTITIGPAGTGKSYCGAAAAAHLLLEGKIEKIYLTRSPIPTGVTAGFRPGDTYEKLIPYLRPLIETLKKVMRTDTGSDGLFNYLWEKKTIEILDIETAKGMTLENAFLIIEEAQECDMEQLKNLLTRSSDSTHVFVNGDTRQSNTRLRGRNALEQYVGAFLDFNKKLEDGTLKIDGDNDGYYPEWVRPFNVVEFTKHDRNGRGHQTRLMLEVNDLYDI